MGFRLSSFLGGAVKGAVDILEEDETLASKSAALGVKSMKDNYDKVMAENRKLESEVSENIKTLRTFDNTATEAELFAAATNKAYMNMALDAAKANPANFRVGDVVKIKEDNASPLTAMEMLKAYTDIPAVSKSARQAEESSGNFIKDLRSKVSNRAASKAEEQTAKAMGVSIEQLRAASGYVRPEIETGAEFDFSSMQPAKGFKDLKDKAQVDLLKAQDSGVAAQISKAQEKLVRVTAIEDFNKTKGKTEAQVQSDLITEIQEKQSAGDKQGATLATALLRQRQALAKAPGDGKTDADKITQTNLIQVAQRSRTAVIQDTLPPGTFVTSTDAEGNVVTTLRDLSQSDLFRKGSAIAANATIKEMTKPDGTPRSEMHKNAMMSAGIRFDDAGKAIKVPVPELPVRGAKPAAQASSAPAVTPAPAPAGRGTIRQQAAPPAALPVATPPKTGAALKWNPDKGDWE